MRIAMLITSLVLTLLYGWSMQRGGRAQQRAYGALLSAVGVGVIVTVVLFLVLLAMSSR
jgi:hypothetical protein